MRNYKLQSSNSRLILRQAMAINQNINMFVNREYKPALVLHCYFTRVEGS